MPTKTVARRTWLFSHSIGHHVGPEGFTHATAIACAPGGIWYVADTAAAEYGVPKIRKFKGEDEFIAEFGMGDFLWPEGLAIDGDGNVYCSDAHKSHIWVYTADGEHVRDWGDPGSEPGQLNGPSGLAFDKDGNLLVVDALNSRVQRFTEDGRFLSSWGSLGSGEGQFNRPWGITVDPEGNIFVADWGNDRVQKFSPDGTYLGRFGSLFANGGELSRPSDVAIDSAGEVYVVDYGNHRVQIYYPDGDIITALYGDARGFSRAAQRTMDVNPDYMRAFDRVDPVELIRVGRLERPRGIVIDDQDRIMITDSGRGRVQVYAKQKDYTPPQFNA